MKHIPVLAQETLKFLDVKKSDFYIDATFGRGGHSRLILNKLTSGKLISFDKDPDAIKYAKNNIKNDNFIAIHSCFSNIKSYCLKNNILGKIAGIVIDLGVSSPQLEDASRGFSFQKNGPLDMRMDNSIGTPVSEKLNYYDEKKLADIFYKYGEEKKSFQIAKAIKQRINSGKKINTTLELSSLIQNIVSRKEKKHPATRCFQALRMHINQELKVLSLILNDSLSILKTGGKLAVISFHSLEDRIIKKFMVNVTSKYISNNNINFIYSKNDTIIPKAKWIKKKCRASQEERILNIRSRSGLLRVIEKT